MKTKILMAVFFSALSFQAFSETEMEDEMVMTTEESAKTISTGRYIGGGLATLFLGLGIGHAVQGRYSERGWIFTAGGAALYIGAIGLLANSASSMTTSLQASETPTLSGSSYAFLGLALVGAGISLWELIDVWMLPSDYKIVKKSPFEIKPLAFYDPYKKLNYGLSLKYSF